MNKTLTIATTSLGFTEMLTFCSTGTCTIECQFDIAVVKTMVELLQLKY